MDTQQTTFARRWLKSLGLFLAMGALVSACDCVPPDNELYYDLDNDGCSDVYLGDAADTIEPNVDDAVEPTSDTDVALSATGASGLEAADLHAKVTPVKSKGLCPGEVEKVLNL
ncbi:MAG: hypothetical protein GKR89_05350 [Candidatus Latescibacteria bacterium]|nr:hypothetical protein [Candidatus Latescibacterota bacterium]